MRALFLLLSLLIPSAILSRPLPFSDPQAVAALAALAPDLPGWHCAPQEMAEFMQPLVPYLPVVLLKCGHEGAEIELTIIVDPANDFLCRSMRRELEAQTRNGSTSRYSNPESAFWLSERSATQFRACASDQIYVSASLNRGAAVSPSDESEFALFLAALIAADPANALSFAPESNARLEEAYAILGEESHALNSHLPRPEGWQVTDSFLMDTVWFRLLLVPLPTSAMILAEGPFARHTLSRGNCRIRVSLSASQEAMQEARRSYAKPRRRDGATDSLWRTHVTERFRGKVSLDDRRWMMLVDDAVVLNVEAMGDCDDVTGVTTALFESMTKEDLSNFRRW